jgi:hypothetical protein
MMLESVDPGGIAPRLSRHPQVTRRSSMPYRDIRQFIARLDAADELLEIDAEVDP